MDDDPTNERPSTSTPLYEELVQLALSGRGWSMVLARLAAVTGRSVRLLGVHGGVLAAAPEHATAGASPTAIAGLVDSRIPAPVECTDGWSGMAVALQAGSRRIGVLALEEPVTDEQRNALLDARVAVSIEAVRRDAEATARAETMSRLIDEVRFGPLRDPEEVVRAGARFGLALDRPHVGAVFAYDGEKRRTWATALRWIEMPVLHDRGLGWTILEPSPDEVARIRTRIQGMIGDDAPVLAATGSAVSGVHDTARSFFEAETILAMLRRRPGVVQLDFASLGVAGLLLSVPVERLTSFVEEQLGPILGRADLRETLEVWLENNGSRAAVAERLFIHRNSVGYRVGKIRELLGVDPLDAAVSLQLQSALAATEVLTALGDVGDTERGDAFRARARDR